MQFRWLTQLIDGGSTMKGIGLVSLAVATALTCGCNKNQQASNANTPAGSAAVGTAGRNANEVSAADRDFVQDVAIANTAEIELGRLAAERGQSAEVKKYGQMMVDDHTAAGDKFKSVASQYAIDVPTRIDDKHNDLRDKLSKKQGLDFDRDYADAMVDGHQDFVNKLESRIDKSNLTDWKARIGEKLGKTEPDATNKDQVVTPEKSDNAATMSLNQWAADTYPTAYAHLQSAKALKDTLKKRTTN
jgi:putative membrane protein